MPRLTMAGLMFEARQMKSDDEENSEYDRGVLELANTMLGRGQSDLMKTAQELGYSKAYAESLYQDEPVEGAGADSIPIETEKKVQAVEGPRLFHVVMEHATVTCLTRDDAMEFLGPVKVEMVVMCESKVSGEEYDRVSKWRGAVE